MSMTHDAKTCAPNAIGHAKTFFSSRWKGESVAHTRLRIHGAGGRPRRLCSAPVRVPAQTEADDAGAADADTDADVGDRAAARTAVKSATRSLFRAGRTGPPSTGGAGRNVSRKDGSVAQCCAANTTHVTSQHAWDNS